MANGSSQKASVTWLLFGISGRASRSAYFLGGLFVAVFQLFALYQFMQTVPNSPEGDLWSSIFSVILLVSLWINFALNVKRLHDFGKPGIVALVTFVPIVTFIAFVAFCIIPGDKGPNRYGAITNAPR
jgi:uncharacterized membrane protein YhaH (DUF805 family)